MKKRSAYALLLSALLIVGLAGHFWISHGRITKVGVSEFAGYGKVNPDFFAVFEDRAVLNLVKLTLKRAVKQQGIANYADAHYDVEVTYANGRVKGFHLWLGAKGQTGALMDVKHTHTIYTIPRGLASEWMERLAPYGDQTPDEPDEPDESHEPHDAVDAVDAEQTASPIEEPEADEPAAGDHEAGDFTIMAGDASIPLGGWDNAIDLEAILGPPVSQTVEVIENADTLTGSLLKKMHYDGLQLELFSPKQNGETFWILTMKAVKEGYGTPKGIAVGSTLTNLLTAYPEIGMAPDGRTDPDNAAYLISDELGERFLRFEIADGRVAEIYIYRLIN